MITTRIVHAAALGLALFAVGVRSAASPSAEEEPSPPALTVQAFAIDRSGIDHSDAAYAVSGVGVEAAFCHWEIGVARQWYDWDRPGDFPEPTGGADPWRDLTRLRIGFSHGFQLSDAWSAEVLAGVAGGFETELDDSFAVYLGGTGLYRASPDWWILCGLLHTRHPEVDTDFEWVPLLGVAWRPTATRGPSFQLGLPVTRARWHFSEGARLSLDLSTLEGGVYRLADDSPARPGGYAEMMNACLTLNLELRLREDLEFSAGIGHSLRRELTLYDADGGNALSRDIDPAPSLQLSLRKHF